MIHTLCGCEMGTNWPSAHVMQLDHMLGFKLYHWPTTPAPDKNFRPDQTQKSSGRKENFTVLTILNIENHATEEDSLTSFKIVLRLFRIFKSVRSAWALFGWFPSWQVPRASKYRLFEFWSIYSVINSVLSLSLFRVNEVNTKEVESRLIYYNKTTTQINYYAGWQIYHGRVPGFSARHSTTVLMADQILSFFFLRPKFRQIGNTVRALVRNNPLKGGLRGTALRCKCTQWCTAALPKTWQKQFTLHTL